MTLIERLTTTRTFIMKEFEKETITLEWSDKDVSQLQKTDPHEVEVGVFSNAGNEDLKETIRTVLGASKWNNARPFLRIVLERYDIWFLWLQYFKRIQDGEIKDDANAKKLQKWNQRRGTIL